MKRGHTYQVMWWPMRVPIPKGWRIAKQQPTHHSRYSILIQRGGR